MPSSTSPLTRTAFVSPRLGVENMDGQGILTGQPKSHARPWTGACIPLEDLTRDHLPPFYVRLPDDQVGHLAHWVATSRGSITRLKLGQVWPWDFDAQGKISSRRDRWGSEYVGCGKERGKGLGGGKKVPTWTDAGLPLTCTSSHKIMAGELDALEKDGVLKRKAEEEACRDVCMPVKKPRLGDMGVELKRLNENGEKKRQKDKVVEKENEKGRYAGTKPELRDAMQVVDTLMRSATETEAQNVTLEAMLLKNEADYIKNTDDMFDEWLAYNEVKRIQVNRIHQDHATEIKSCNAKIVALEKDVKGSRARLDKEKQKIKIRDERLTQVKSYWAQEQEVIERKLREIEERMVDLDGLSQLNHDTDESKDEESDDEKSGFEVEAEEAKEVQKPEPQTAKEQAMEAPMGEEVKGSIEPKSVDGKEVNHLNEDEDEEEEGPIVVSRQRTAKLRSSARTKPVQDVDLEEEAGN